MRYLLLILALASASCDERSHESLRKSAEADTITLYHEGLCFVVFDDDATGVAMVQVNCEDLQAEEGPLR